LPSGNRERLVDCMGEFVKYTIVMRPHFELFEDRFSERKEKHDREIRSMTVKNDIVDKILFCFRWKIERSRWGHFVLDRPVDSGVRILSLG